MKYKFDYDINESGMLILKGLAFRNRYVEVPREDRFRKLYSYILIDIDLSYALEFLVRCINMYDDIDRICYFQMAVIKYSKCYSPSKKDGRSQLSATKVYKGIEEDPIGCHNKFIEMRNKYFAHDENDFKASKLGAILNIDERKMMGIAYPQMQAKFDYFETIAILMKLCEITKNWIGEELDKEIECVRKYVEQRGFDILNNYKDLTISKSWGLD